MQDDVQANSESVQCRVFQTCKTFDYQYRQFSCYYALPYLSGIRHTYYIYTLWSMWSRDLRHVPFDIILILLWYFPWSIGLPHQTFVALGPPDVSKEPKNYKSRSPITHVRPLLQAPLSTNCILGQKIKSMFFSRNTVCFRFIQHLLFSLVQ